ncbi:MAG: GtrA family protein [Acidobacteriota bacterium]
MATSAPWRLIPPSGFHHRGYRAVARAAADLQWLNLYQPRWLCVLSSRTCRGALVAHPTGMHRTKVLAGLSGIAATAIDVTTLVLMVHAGDSVALSAFCGATAGAATGFTLNKYVAFRDRTSITLQQLGRFGLVAVATALLMALLMHVAVVDVGVPVLLAKLVCSSLVFAAWTYPAQRRLVFLPVARSYS